ncbi:hypothetical protein V8G54_011688 [Vigna mungo]|uniref:Short-chain dehydrogenase TIC 32, chloroplastic n=1 Tax=Vigna mungo TaxID=3915 RepID=A0AAQ3NSQ1_VIGMU
MGHRFTYPKGILFDKLNDPSSYSSWRAYGQSKLANILHANELVRRLKEDGVDITANSLHPGATVTNIYLQSPLLTGVWNLIRPFVIHILAGNVVKTVQQVSLTH